MLTTFKLAALAATVTLGTGMLHNHLVKSSPGKDEQLSSAPKEVRLWFSERPEVAFTSVTLMQEDSTRIATVKAVATTDSLVVAAPLTMALPPGKYLVGWRTASRDGHAIRGVFGFTIAP